MLVISIILLNKNHSNSVIRGRQDRGNNRDCSWGEREAEHALGIVSKPQKRHVGDGILDELRIHFLIAT
jgi:hypothetical protein